MKQDATESETVTPETANTEPAVPEKGRDLIPRIFVFVNGGFYGDVALDALAEDGHFLAEHISTNETFGQADMGVTSQKKHDLYRKHYPDGYQVVWVPTSEVKARTHEGLRAAYEKHLALGEDSRE